MPDALPDLTLLHYVVLLLAGLASGVINTVAGGGSVITLPVLIFVGLPGSIANATNRIGVVGQNIMALRQFRRGGVSENHLSWRVAIVAIIGSIAGTLLAAYLPDDRFEKILGVLMLGLLVLILKKPKPRLLGPGETPEDAWEPLGFKQKASVLTAFFFLGAYGGFLQAGVGIMILTTLGYLMRLDLVRGNYVKLLVILGVTAISIVTFLLSGVQMAWLAGILLGVGQIIGAVIGSWVAIEKGEKWIMVILVVMILVSSAKLLGLIDFLLT